MSDQSSEDLQSHHSLEGSILIMREISRILAEERIKRLIPLVGKALENAGVDFSQADVTKLDNCIEEKVWE